MDVNATAARLYEPILGGMLSGMRRQCVALLPEKGPLLDCCCGPGGLTRLLLHAGRDVTGVDNDKYMLAQAGKNAPAAQLLEADAASLPFADGHFAGAVISLALHAMPLAQAKVVLHELSRVAGQIIIADYCLAERNISLPATLLAHGLERMVGGEHYHNYRLWMAAGALEGFLRREGCTVQDRALALGGAALVARCPGAISVA